MNISVLPGTARGVVDVPASKSVARRLLLGAALARGESVIHHVPDGADVRATLSCLTALGIVWTREGDMVTVLGGNPRYVAPLPCGESGSTLRFFLPAVLVLGKTARLEAAPALMRRPMDVFEDICRERGMLFRADAHGYTVRGLLKSGVYELPGNVSSQFITGLLFALPRLDGDSTIRLTTDMESRPYIDMTLDVLARFEVAAQWGSRREIAVPGGQRFSPVTQTVEGDFSSAAPLLALNALGGDVTVRGLPAHTRQGDAICEKYILSIAEERPVIDLSDCPDLGPVLMALAALKHGAVFTGTRRLRLKESDRVEAMRAELEKMGCILTAKSDRVTVPECELHAPARPLSSHNDHRIAMACGMLLSVTGGMLEGAEAVNKSYPGFFDTLARLGITIS